MNEHNVIKYKRKEIADRPAGWSDCPTDSFEVTSWTSSFTQEIAKKIKNRVQILFLLLLKWDMDWKETTKTLNGQIWF